MKKSPLLAAVCASLFSFISLPSHAELVDNGGGLIYDTVLDITWAQPRSTRIATWEAAKTWAAGLTLGGVSGWRLPYISVVAGSGPLPGNPHPTACEIDWNELYCPVYCNTATELACRDNELGYMYYHNLSGTRRQSILTSGDPDLALFPSIQTDSIYWSGTEAYNSRTWIFFFNDVNGGGQTDGIFGVRAWAVHSGNVQENPDADGDGVNDDEDLCPDTAPEAAVDAVGCSDAQVDGDGDGVCNDGAVSNGPSTCVGADACPGTVIPEGVPTVRLGTNRWALVDDDFEFDTTAPNGKGPGRCYSTVDTGGCSCEQIIAALELGKGHTKHGCSIAAMDGWVALPR